MIKLMNILNELETKILYSAVVLDEKSHGLLLKEFSDFIPEDWKKFAHHMTIAFGKGVENPDDLGKEVTLRVTELGISDMAMAVRVEGYQSSNAIPHITLAINPNGGKPVMSNQIKDWKQVKSFDITGKVTNVLK
jgi:hypothetical protein